MFSKTINISDLCNRGHGVLLSFTSISPWPVGLKNQLVDPGMFRYHPPLRIPGISLNFPTK